MLDIEVVGMGFWQLEVIGEYRKKETKITSRRHKVLETAI